MKSSRLVEPVVRAARFGAVQAPEVIARVNATLNKILQQPETKALLADQGSEPAPGTPAQFADFIAKEIPLWRRLVEVSGASVN